MVNALVRHSQSLSVSVEQRLAEALVLGDGLQDAAVGRHVADGPLAQARAAQPEDVTAKGTQRKHVSFNCTWRPPLNAVYLASMNGFKNCVKTRKE